MICYSSVSTLIQTVSKFKPTSKGENLKCIWNIQVSRFGNIQKQSSLVLRRSHWSNVSKDKDSQIVWKWKYEMQGNEQNRFYLADNYNQIFTLNCIYYVRQFFCIIGFWKLCAVVCHQKKNWFRKQRYMLDIYIYISRTTFLKTELLLTPPSLAETRIDKSPDFFT